MPLKVQYRDSAGDRELLTREWRLLPSGATLDTRGTLLSVSEHVLVAGVGATGPLTVSVDGQPRQLDGRGPSLLSHSTRAAGPTGRAPVSQTTNRHWSTMQEHRHSPADEDYLVNPAQGGGLVRPCRA